MDKSKQYTVFFSWQSDFPQSRRIISDALKNAKKVLASKKQPIDIIIDQGTDKVPGIPQIDTTILSKIMNCDVFVADITPVHVIEEDLLPNPNVLLELGFAMGVVGMSCIILLAKEGEWKVKDLPFDINHKRIDFFKDEEELKGLGKWIKCCIESSEESGKSDDRMRRIEHDIKKFREFDKFWSEDVFLSSFETISNSALFNDYELDLWYDVKYWLMKSENLFVTNTIKEAALSLLHSLSDFLQFTVKYWSSSYRRWCSDIPKDKKDELRIKLQRYYEWEPEGDKNSPLYRQREEVVEKGLNKYLPPIGVAYREFRSAVKSELYV